MWDQLCIRLLCLFLAGISCVKCDEPPRFTNVSPLFTVKEDTAIGTSIFKLRATDRDTDENLAFSLSGGLAEDEKNLLRLSTPRRVSAPSNTWECDIILNDNLDRDNRPSTRTLYYQVYDGNYYDLVILSMIINDVNDNPPSFTSLPYRTSVKENAPVHQSVFQVSATDPDLGRGGRVLFSMRANNDVDEAEYRETFHLDRSLGKVTLAGPLDYTDRSFYHFRVKAQDDDGNYTCPGPLCRCKPKTSNDDYCDGEEVDLFITIIDEQNTPPVFEKLPYFATINESLPVDSTVIQTKAVDGDRGVARPNNISYSLKNDTFIPFQIDAMSGVVTVGQALDADNPNVRLKGGLYSFYVIATEMTDGQLTNASSSTRVTITVTDVNDNEPKFKQSSYEAKVIENTPQGTPVSMTSTIRIEDIDQAENSQFQIFIETENGEADANFKTIPGQNEKVQGSTTVTILVENSTLLDYERTKDLTIKLVAREQRTDGAVAHSSEATVHIIVEDANDHNPVFLTNQSEFNVPENVSTNHLVTTARAEDHDSGDFGVVTFSLEDSGDSKAPFKMHKNGSLTVVGHLDRELLDTYSLMVVAMDNPNASESQRRRSLKRISIHVLDINDNGPVWPKAIPSFSVSETDEIGQNVGYLRATDDDIGRNGELEYSLQAGAPFFEVNKTVDGWANLFVNQNLAGHSGTRNVTIIATDRGDEPRSATVSVTVLIVDVNIHSPEFVKPDRNITNWTLQIEEELNIGTIIADFIATDKDKGQNGAVEYTLLPSNKDSNFFKIDRLNGSLMVAGRLDGDVKDFYEITVQAKDNGQPTARSQSLKVFINLIDIDDNKPSYKVIDTPMPFHLTVEEENASAIIGKVEEAIDLDSDPKNKVVCYYLYGGDLIDYFVLRKRTRVLSLQKKLDWETTKMLNIVIKASSNCSELIVPIPSNTEQNSSGMSRPQMYNPSDMSLLWIEITVTDTNDHGPKFKHQEFTGGVLYDASLGTVVMSLTNDVQDGDGPKNKKNVFRLLSLTPSPEMQRSLDTKTPAFNLSKNGNVSTAIRFRPDMLGFFLLKVQVYDSDGFNDTTQVKIYIVSNLQRVKLVFSKLPNQVAAIKERLFKELSEILGFQIIADKIVTHTNPDGTTDPKQTDVFIHGRYDNGEVVPASKLWSAFDVNSAANSLLTSNGVLQAKDLLGVNDENGDDNPRYFVIIIAVLTILLIAVILVFINMMRIYRRRLKAATTKAFALPKEQEMYEHPGTNKYYSAENPLFGKDIKNPELEDEKLSANSLDINAVDHFSKSNAEPEEEQEVVLQITDSALSTPQHNQQGHLDKVLQEYDNSVKSKDNNTYEDTSPAQIPSKLLSGRRPGTIIPGLGTEIQEGVTRFSDESLSGDSGFPDGENSLAMSRGHLEYSDI